MSTDITWKYKHGDVFKDDKRNIVIIGRKLRKKEYLYKKSNRTYIKKQKWYKYKCNKCGWDNGWMQESDITKGVGCSCCKGITAVKGINDFGTAKPELVKYLENENEAYTHTKTSSKIAHLKCPECGQKDEKSFSRLYIDGYSCKRCKSVGVLRPDLIKYYINQKKAFEQGVGGRELMKFKCPNCGYVKLMDSHDLCADGFRCPICSDGISYPEKFVMNFLDQLGVKYIYQLTSKYFNWCKKYRYDFYLVDYNYIIEVHGSQHYYEKQHFFNSTLIDVQNNDKNKMLNAIENDIKRYIVIPATRSRLNELKNSIIDKFKDEFELSNVDWIKCGEFASKSIVKDVCEYFNENKSKIYIIDEICDKYKISYSCLRNYLHRGNENGWCNYVPGEIKTKKPLKHVHNSIPVNIYDCYNKLVYEGKSIADVEKYAKNELKLSISYYRIKSLCENNNIYRNYYFRLRKDIKEHS